MSEPEPAIYAEPPAAEPAPTLAVAPTPAPAPPTPPTAREIRRARARRLLIRFSLWVGIPTLLATVYYAGLASHQYDSSAVFSIETNDPNADEARGKTATGHQRDARLVRDRIRSRELIAGLTDTGLIAHYQDASIDWWSRLADDAGADEIYDYYRHKVNVTIDAQSSAVTLRVRAFSPTRAQAAARAIVAAAEAFVADTSARSAAELITPAEHEVTRARERLAAARHAMLAVTGGAEPTPEQLSEPAVMERELAQIALNSALEAQQTARIEAVHSERYLVMIDAPSLPDTVARPRPLWDIATVFVTAMVLVSVLSLLGTAVREHANF